MNDPKTLGSTDLKRLHRTWRRKTEGRVSLLLDSVQTPFNVGAIVRSAASFGVDHLWLAGATEAPNHQRARKTSLGTERYLTWTAAETPTEAADLAEADGYRLIAVELADGAQPLHEIDLTGDICLIVGHEDRGVSADLLARVAGIGYVPQIGRVGSLNVAAAASIAVYEARRQGWIATQLE